MSRGSRSTRYFNQVGRERDRLDREERHARGELTEQEQWARDLTARVQADGDQSRANRLDKSDA
jgi:hypothetical protein